MNFLSSTELRCGLNLSYPIITTMQLGTKQNTSPTKIQMIDELNPSYRLNISSIKIENNIVSQPSLLGHSWQPPRQPADVEQRYYMHIKQLKRQISPLTPSRDVTRGIEKGNLSHTSRQLVNQTSTCIFCSILGSYI